MNVLLNGSFDSPFFQACRCHCSAVTLEDATLKESDSHYAAHY